MKTKYAEIPEPAAHVFGRVRNSMHSGTMPRASSSGALADDYVHTPQAKSRSRELPTIGMIGVLVIAALVVAAYINNTVTVDNLMRTMTRKEKELQSLVQQREAVRAELNLLTSSTRIQAIATQQLRLEHSKIQPFSLEVTGYLPRGSTHTVK